MFANRFPFLLQLLFSGFDVKLFRLSVLDEEFESFGLVVVLLLLCSGFVVVGGVSPLLGLTNFENSEKKK